MSKRRWHSSLRPKTRARPVHVAPAVRRKRQLVLLAILIACVPCACVVSILLYVNAYSATGQALCIAFLKTKEELVVGGLFGEISVVDAAGNETGQRISVGCDFVNDVAVAQDAMLVVSAGSDGRIHVWTLQGEPVFWQAHDHSVESIDVTDDGLKIVSGDFAGTVTVWNTETRESVWSQQGHEYGVTAVAFQPLHDAVASAGHDGKIRLWDAAGQLTQTIELPWKINRYGEYQEDRPGSPRVSYDAPGVRCIAFSSDGENLVSGEHHGILRVWNVSTGEEVLRIDGFDIIRCVAFSPDDTLIAKGTANGDVFIVDRTEQGRSDRIQRHGAVDDILFSPDGTRVLFASSRVYEYELSRRGLRTVVDYY